MRLTSIMLLGLCLQVSARAYTQTVSFSGDKVPLEKVFAAVERQTGYVFFFDEALLRGSKPVTIRADNTPLETFLNELLKDQPLKYSFQNKTIVISRRTQTLDQTLPPADTALRPDPRVKIAVKGTVYNESGQPLSGANITIKTTGKGTITNAKGEFQLPAVPQNSPLVISFIGYAPQVVKISEGRIMQVYLNVTKNDLDKVVVQAYGTTSQRYATGDIGVVTAEEIEKQPVMNPLMALQGRVAGLEVVQTSGYASAPLKVEIRGRGIVDPTQVSDPLYIVDGVPLSVLEVGGNSSYASGSAGFLQNPGLTGPANGQSPLFSINPTDIESISVLKDADATSIYGSRGANGVIIITTKKGKPGKTKFDVHVDQGVNKITRFWEMLNTPQYLEMRREAFRNDAMAPNPGNAPDLLTWDTTRYTDWQRALYGRAGQVTNMQVGISGGDLHTTFRIGAGYTQSAEITTASGADKRGTISFSVMNKSDEDRLIISLTGSYSSTESDLVTLPQYSTFAPDAPSIYDSSGKLNWIDWRPINGNPFGTLLRTYLSRTNFLNSNLGITYQFIRGLSLTINSGYNIGQANQFGTVPIASKDPATQPTGSAYFGNNSNKNWVIEPQISYDARLGKGKFNVLVGGSAQQTTTDGIYIEGDGYTTDALLHTISNAPKQTTKDNDGEYRYASLFARIGYNLGNEYIINLSARRDGSSNYGPGNQFGNFASIGGAWIFTEEDWFKQHFSFLSFGKLRGSYGITGSDGGVPYAYLTRWSSNGQQTYTGGIPIVPIQHANPNYRWQQNKQLEGAIDMGFFKDWVTLGVAYYRRRTGNQLLAYPTAIFTGFANVIANLNALVQNAGWEFNIGGRGVHVHSKFFNWDWAPHFNFTINENEFVSFPGLGSSPYRNSGVIGHPLNSVYLLHYTGVDPQTGVYTYEDKNHDGVINNNQFGTNGDGYFKKLSPSFSTGFGSDFEVKGIHLSLFFTVKKQTGINALAQGNYPGFFNVNQPVEVLARWQKPGDITNVGKFSTMYAQDPNLYLSSSDIGYTDASYIRLQNLSISYTLPESLTKRSGFKCSLYVHANNLLTITKYKGIDPETQNFGGMPPAKTVVGGISLNF